VRFAILGIRAARYDPPTRPLPSMSEMPPSLAGATAAEPHYLQRRLEEQRRWHSRKATGNKRLFLAAEITTLLAGALIPIVNVWALDDPWSARVLSAVLGAIVVAAAGIARLFKFQENWLQYRAIAEALSQERELYLSRIGAYAVPDDRRDALLVERVEMLLANTTARFLATQRTESAAAGAGARLAGK
jgi:hypothetical protein